MYTIKNKPKSGKTVWDPEKGKELLKFKDGRFETEDVYVAEKAKELGYEVEGFMAPEKSQKGQEKADKAGKTSGSKDTTQSKSGSRQEKADESGKTSGSKDTTQSKSGSRQEKTDK